ncbi:MAG: hypothetical protein HY513_03110 [Candidatus Aenigmarchaeota archaeon]|nr:hypothetical protein [Candidatus Aenigmarchaeota archaeon]
MQKKYLAIALLSLASCSTQKKVADFHNYYGEIDGYEALIHTRGKTRDVHIYARPETNPFFNELRAIDEDGDLNFEIIKARFQPVGGITCDLAKEEPSDTQDRAITLLTKSVLIIESPSYEIGVGHE